MCISPECLDFALKAKDPHCSRASAKCLSAVYYGLASVVLAMEVLAPARAATPPDIPLEHALVIRSVTRPGRSAVHVDPIEARIVAGDWHAPAAGDAATVRNGEEQHWESVTAPSPGVLKGATVRGGYVYWEVPSDHEQVMLLEAAGHNCVYVNGEIRGGDAYGYGYLRLPVVLHAGTNQFLFQSGRGDLRAKLVPPSQALSINTADNTLPDLIGGETEPVWGAVVLLNATTNFMHASIRALDRASPTNFVSIPPLGICKAPLLLFAPSSTSSNKYAEPLEAVDLTDRAAEPARATIELRVRRPDQTYMRTFRSALDGSVQYYAVNPASGSPASDERPALFLSLHGAAVEARGQAEAYSPKRWGPIVCPTNRRPYGFDWEEWGRRDAMEVLSLAKLQYKPDPRSIYLTGHSMGGHGTWQLGAIYPDQFAAIGASAGWISFTSYANRNAPAATNSMQKMLQRAAAASDTLLMATNYLQEGVYILHGDADDNVPVTEAREMRNVLGGFHHDFDFHEQPGAGHWWDASDEPGADCVDWAPMFDFFAHHIIPADDSIRRVRFVTVNPAVSSRSHWVSILAQERALEPSVVDLRCDPGKRRIAGTTQNVRRLALEFPSISPGPGLTIELDGQNLESVPLPDMSIAAANDGRNRPTLNLLLVDGKWRVAEPASPSEKGPERSGPFREAFANHMVLVYGTQGTPEENAWALARARYDAETFYYRGNASVELVRDLDIVAQHGEWKNSSRNLILYGHAECNAAWPELLATSPVQVHRGRVRVGEREITGDDVGCLFLQPHPRDAKALVGVVAGTGMPGLRVTEREPYFMSGAGFPDCLLIGAEMPAEGVKGLRAAGFFGADWQVSTGDFVWRE